MSHANARSAPGRGAANNPPSGRQPLNYRLRSCAAPVDLQLARSLGGDRQISGRRPRPGAPCARRAHARPSRSRRSSRPETPALSSAAVPDRSNRARDPRGRPGPKRSAAHREAIVRFCNHETTGRLNASAGAAVYFSFGLTRRRSSSRSTKSPGRSGASPNPRHEPPRPPLIVAVGVAHRLGECALLDLDAPDQNQGRSDHGDEKRRPDAGD